jgi:hypothetical protein
MTVGELKALIAAVPDEELVVATWESVFRDIEVFQAPNGTLVIDAEPGVQVIGTKTYRQMIEREEGFMVPPSVHDEG